MNALCTVTRILSVIAPNSRSSTILFFFFLDFYDYLASETVYNHHWDEFTNFLKHFINFFLC